MRRALGWAWLAVSVAVAGAAVLSGPSAGAFHTDRDDGNDTKGILDVSRVRLDHRRSPHVARVITFRTWSPARIWDRGYLVVFLDTRYGEDPEHFVLVRSIGRRLHASLHRARANGPDPVLASVKVRRPSGRSVAVNLPFIKMLVGPSRTEYRWWVYTLLSEGVCPKVCIDRVPNRGSIEQPLPGVTPSPSPSPSPSPT